MNSLLKISLLLAAPAALIFTACSPADELGNTAKRAEVRYKITVTVDTPDGVRSGSSVWSTRISKPTMALASPYDSKFKGEAVAVDLPNGRTVFALLKETIFSRQFRSLHRDKHPEDRVAHYAAIANSVGEKIEVPCEERSEYLPSAERMAYRFDCLMLASFADITDPTSVFQVDYHDAAATLGEGYAIQSITIEITDEPVTTGLARRLQQAGWEKGQGLNRTKGITANPTLGQQLGYIDFVKGTEK